MTEHLPEWAAAPDQGLRRIGLFGGTFDPPHRAHLALAAAARDSLALDELRWIPAGQPWQKGDAVSAAQHREAMVRLAISGESRFVLDDCEVRRDGPSYTIDTVEALQAQAPPARWYLLIGLDQHAGLHTWRRFEDLLQRVTLAVAARPGVAAPTGQLPCAWPPVRVPLPPLPISSTDIRRRVAQGEPIDHLVPPGVARYIDQHHLYRKDAVAH